mgnify:CR=1 FL=1
MNKSRSLSILLGPLLLAPLAQAEVVINEIMFQPPYAENTPEPLGEEYIELHNTDGVNPVSLDGWALDSGVGYAFAGTVIPAGGFLIVAAVRRNLRSSIRR